MFLQNRQIPKDFATNLRQRLQLPADIDFAYGQVILPKDPYEKLIEYASVTLHSNCTHFNEFYDHNWKF